MLIKDCLEECEGVERVEVSHQTGALKVVIDQTKVNEKSIKDIISNEGYRVS